MVGKGREREKIKIIVPITSYQIRNREFKKIAKKLKNFKNTIMASFHAKIGWKRQKIEKIKIMVPFRSYLTG